MYFVVRLAAALYPASLNESRTYRVPLCGIVDMIQRGLCWVVTIFWLASLFHFQYTSVGVLGIDYASILAIHLRLFERYLYARMVTLTRDKARGMGPT